MRTPSPFYQQVRENAAHRWSQLEAYPELAAPWWQLFRQVQSPRHVISELMQNAEGGERVTVSGAPAAGYGLTASERHEGWDALNQPQEAEVVLSDSPFRVVLPRVVRYCTHYPVWGHPPSPPMRFTLRFSDSPDEHYIVFHSRKTATYVVRDSNGVEVSQEQARWRLSLGDLEPIDPAGTPERTWLRHIAFARPRATNASQSRANLWTASSNSPCARRCTGWMADGLREVTLPRTGRTQ